MLPDRMWHAILALILLAFILVPLNIEMPNPKVLYFQSIPSITNIVSKTATNARNDTISCKTLVSLTSFRDYLPRRVLLEAPAVPNLLGEVTRKTCARVSLHVQVARLQIVRANYHMQSSLAHDRTSSITNRPFFVDARDYNRFMTMGDNIWVWCLKAIF